MKILLAAALFCVAAEAFPDMTPGRYDVQLQGFICRTCARAVVEELQALKEVEKAVGDFERESILVTIRPGNTLRISQLRKALRRAASRVDLGTKFELLSVKYRV